MQQTFMMTHVPTEITITNFINKKTLKLFFETRNFLKLILNFTLSPPIMKNWLYSVLDVNNYDLLCIFTRRNILKYSNH